MPPVSTRAVLLGLSSALFGCTSVAQTCQTTTVTDDVPTEGNNVALQSYSYCGGYLTASAYIANLDYDKIVTLYYTNGQNLSTPLSSVVLGYNSSIANTNYELWGANVPVYVDGITELLNLTFQATDIGQTYSSYLGLTVTASGAPAPDVSTQVPAPYASPSGLAQDMTAWLDATNTSSATSLGKGFMFLNINPDVEGAVNGTVVAAQSGPTFTQTDPDYEYNWVRDSSLTMDVVQTFYAASNGSNMTSAYETILFEYATGRATEQNDPNLQTGLGEPKFYLNQTIFSGPWGRPQNDGPATAAITLMEFANTYLANGGSMSTVLNQLYNSTANSQAPILKDLLFVASNWSSPSFDLWEEEESTHFYTRMVQRRALVMGAQFATDMSDSETVSTLTAAASDLTASLSEFWDPNRQLILYEYGPILNNKASFKDIAVVLGVLHGYAGDDVYSYTNDQVLASALQISTSFLSVFPIANITTDSTGQLLGIPIGRYPEDIFNGTGTLPNGGNPWFLATASMAELLYRAALFYNTTSDITVTPTSAPFFTYYAPTANVTANNTYTSSSPEFTTVIDSLLGWGDAYMRRIRFHAGDSGHLTEEYNRNTGVVQGAADLTWSYAALLTASFARAEVLGDEGFVAELAAQGTNVRVSNSG